MKINVRKLADGIPEAVLLPIGHVPGAMEAGTRIEKVRGEPGDSTAIGDQGTVLSSIRDERVGPNTFYFVAWDHAPGVPVGVIDWKIGPL